jgi:hypothetical protein
MSQVDVAIAGNFTGLQSISGDLRQFGTSSILIVRMRLYRRFSVDPGRVS